VYVPGGSGVALLAEERDAFDWVCEASRHCKPIGATGERVELLRRCPGVLEGGARRGRDAGLFAAERASAELIGDFVAAIARHRVWEREGRNRLGAPGDRETRGFGAPPAQPRAGPAQRPGL